MTVYPSASIRMQTVGACPACSSPKASLVGSVLDVLTTEMNRFLPVSEHIIPVVNTMVACDCCGLRYLDPRISSPDLQALYEVWYGRIFPSTRIGGTERVSREHEFLTYHLPLLRKVTPSGSILDVGTGTGLFVKLARDAGYSAVGVERSAEAASYGRVEYGAKILNGVLSDVRLGPFDAITMFDYLEHAEAPRHDIEAAVRLLKSQGVLIIRVPNSDSWLSRLRGLSWINVISFHLSYFDEAALSGLIERAGLRIEAVTKRNVHTVSQILALKFAWVKHRFGDTTNVAAVGPITALPRLEAVKAGLRFAGASTLEMLEHLSGWFDRGSVMSIIARKMG